MKEKFNIIIKNYVHPKLKSNGFKKKNLNFYKFKGDLIFLINLQKSRGNTWEETSFYISYGIYSSEIDNVLGKEKIMYPKDYQCYYCREIKELLDVNDTSKYILENSTNVEKFGKNILVDLEIVISFFEKVKGTDDLISLMIAKNKLHWYEEMISYLILTEDENRAEKYIYSLFEYFGKENRWKIFENKIETILTLNKSKINLLGLLK